MAGEEDPLRDAERVAREQRRRVEPDRERRRAEPAEGDRDRDAPSDPAPVPDESVVREELRRHDSELTGDDADA